MSDTNKISQEEIADFNSKFAALSNEMSKAIVGYEDCIEHLLVCFMAGGNLLIES
ncbi:MAG: hypothetical protein HRU15_04640, partial [Planctomycetes bacterium]|nr:hypothetical protein [Planctomycetota bacterium]